MAEEKSTSNNDGGDKSSNSGFKIMVLKAGGAVFATVIAPLLLIFGTKLSDVFVAKLQQQPEAAQPEAPPKPSAATVPAASTPVAGAATAAPVDVASGKAIVQTSPATSGAGPSSKPWTTSAFQRWIEDVAAMPAEKQVDAVSKKLVELNPGFNGKVTHKVENGVVTEFEFHTGKVRDISPVRALQGMKMLECRGGNPGGPGQLSDLSPLEGMPLTTLICNSTQVSDLSPLKGMPLSTLVCGGTNVSDLTPLEECKSLIDLRISYTNVTPAGVAALQQALPNCKVLGSKAGKAASGRGRKNP